MDDPNNTPPRSWPPEPEEQRRLLGLAIDRSLNAIGISGTDGVLIYVNAALVEMWGFDRADELLGRPVSDFFLGERIDAILQKMQEQGWAQGTDVAVRRNAERMQVAYSCTTLPAPSGEPAYFFGSFMDVSEQHRLQEVVARRDAEITDLLAAVPGMVYQSGPDWKLDVVSDQCERLCGYPAADLLDGRVQWMDLVHPDDLQKMREETELDAPYVEVDQEYRIRHRDGHLVWVRDVKRLHYDDGVLTYAAGFASDITATRRLKKQLERSDRLATVGLMSAGVAHEMNNPLSVMLGSVELVAEKLERLPDEQRLQLSDVHKSLQMIERTGRRCKRIVDDLLSFGQPSHRAAEPVELSTAVRDALRPLKMQLRERGIQLERSLEDPARVVGIAQHLRLVFSNLLLNAIQSMPEGGTLRLAVLTDPDAPGWALVQIADTGAGIPRRTLSRIFDPFFSTKAVGEGMGLGLSIVHAIVTQHEGRVDFESEVGRGTTVQVLLPLAPGA